MANNKYNDNLAIGLPSGGVRTERLTLKDLAALASKKAIARAILNHMEVEKRLHMEITMTKIHLNIPQLSYDYIRATSESKKKISERICNLIYEDIVKEANRKVGII
jgi:hypothetical protein